MTIWEMLFGTPERAAKALNNASIYAVEWCSIMRSALGEVNREDVMCENCPYENGPDDCEPRDMRWIDWLQQEVRE